MEPDRSNETPGLSLRGLRKAFGDVVAVDGLDLDVPQGSTCALLGPSGCGKTTTLRLIAGLEQPDAGAIEIAGERLAGPGLSVAAERRRIGMVFQDYALFPHLDVAANVGYALGRRPDRDKVEAALAMVGLGGLGKRNPHELSGGSSSESHSPARSSPGHAPSCSTSPSRTSTPACAPASATRCGRFSTSKG